MRYGRTYACLMGIVAMVAGGCGGDGEDAGGDDDPPRETVEQVEDDEPAEADREAEEELAESTLLTLEDFPAGWESEPATPEAEDEESRATIAECLGVDYDVLYPDHPSATSPTFTSESSGEVSSEVTIAPSEGDIAQAMDLLESEAVPGCLGEAFTEALARSAVVSDVPDDVEIGEPTFNRMSFDDLGDRTLAFRVTIPVSVEQLNVELYLDLVLVQVGRAGVEMSFQSELSPFATDEAVRLTQIVVDRVEATVG